MAGGDLTAEVDRRLGAERGHALLVWHAAGTGACTGYPTYEAVPGRLLSAVPLDVLLVSVGEDPQAWAGLARHLADWKSRPDEDLRQVPDEVWDELARVAGNDADKLERLRRKRP